jgi:hypothetical protein
MKFPSYLPSCIQVGRRGSLGWGAARRPWENDGVHNGFIMRLCVNNGFSNGFNQWLIMVLSILIVKKGSQNGLRLFLLHPVFQTWGEILPLKHLLNRNIRRNVNLCNPSSVWIDMDQCSVDSHLENRVDEMLKSPQGNPTWEICREYKLCGELATNPSVVG